MIQLISKLIILINNTITQLNSHQGPLKGRNTSEGRERGAREGRRVG